MVVFNTSKDIAAWVFKDLGSNIFVGIHTCNCDIHALSWILVHVKEITTLDRP